MLKWGLNPKDRRVRDSARLPFWHERQLLRDAKRDDRRAAVLNRLARAGRRAIAINRLAGAGSPGAGSLLEEARKKGEQRHTATLMAARKLRDTDGEALVLDFARVEEERHEATAALKLQQTVHTLEQQRLETVVAELSRKQKELENEKNLHKRRAALLLRENNRLQQRLVRQEQARAMEIEEAQYEVERVRNAEVRLLKRELLAAERRIEDEIVSLQHENRALHALNVTMIAGRKRAQDDVAAFEAEVAAARARY